VTSQLRGDMERVGLTEPVIEAMVEDAGQTADDRLLASVMRKALQSEEFYAESRDYGFILDGTVNVTEVELEVIERVRRG
jgi:hypothetical protein